MSDELISRKAVIEAINSLMGSPYANSPQFGKERKAVLETVKSICIEKLPAAYDLDKVIKVLDTEAECFEDSGRAYECEKELGIAEGFRKAVEYVKDGGESYRTTAYPEGV